MVEITKEKGITLVALVITVIVLLILAGVGISIITGADGLFGKTRTAAEIYNNAAEKEAHLINTLINNIENYKNKEENKEEVRANAPKLLTGMQKVAWDNNNNEITPTTDSEWYDYSVDSKRWANAKTADGSYWVWIPRYAYKITSGLGTSTTGKIDVVFVDTENKNNGKQYATTYPTVTGDAMDDYVVHPAFVNGTANNFANGEWDQDIEGFWVAKFEAGFAGGGRTDANNNVPVKDSGEKYTGSSSATNYYGTVTSNTTTMKYPVFMGRSFSYNYINIGDIYKLSRALTKAGNPYGLNTTTDSHMMKNSEWGAVAYLSHSQYGVNGENTIHINNVNINNKVSTIYGVTGYAGASVDANVNNFSTAPSTLGNSITNGTQTSYAWNTENGQKASSNNNITGVYDLSGGNFEYTAGYMNNTVGASGRDNYGGTLIGTTDKYRTIYPHNSGSDTGANNWLAYKNAQSSTKGFGDGILETASSGSGITSWNSDGSSFPNLGGPFFARGSYYMSNLGAGVFSLVSTTGFMAFYDGFRVVLIG